MKWIAALVTSGLVFGLLDFLWLGEWLAPKPNMTAALLFYAIYIVGVSYFVIVPALESGSLGKSAFSGFLFGLVAYATWDLTNLAVLKDFPSSIVPIDMAWGAIATMVTSIVTFVIVRALPFVE